jgi:hypothetical protein
MFVGWETEMLEDSEACELPGFMASHLQAYALSAMSYEL